MKFTDGDIEGVIVTDLKRHEDPRGWLSEVFRHDEMPEKLHPPMGYVSMTHPGVMRGPHEHQEQTDLFAFVGPSSFKLVLWDRREGSSTYLNRSVIHAGADGPKSVVVPPGVVHAYQNTGQLDGFVINLPNRLFMGEGRADPVDEIRYEDDPDTPYRIEEDQGE